MTAAILDEDADKQTDRGPADARGRLVRLCLATGETRPLAEMIRYVVAPDGSIVPDLSRRLPGRGAWVNATNAALEHAIERKLFSRAFRGKGKAGRDLPQLVEKLLLRAALEALSIANKAGQAVTGFEKIKATLAGERLAALLHASDAGEDGRHKLNALAKNADSEAPAEIRLFSGEQLDLALGRSNVVHAALLDHAASRAFLANCLKYQRWRETGPRADTITDRSRGGQ
jgi:uncharacterized protein